MCFLTLRAKKDTCVWSQTCLKETNINRSSMARCISSCRWRRISINTSSATKDSNALTKSIRWRHSWSLLDWKAPCAVYRWQKRLWSEDSNRKWLSVVGTSARLKALLNNLNWRLSPTRKLGLQFHVSWKLASSEIGSGPRVGTTLKNQTNIPQALTKRWLKSWSSSWRLAISMLLIQTSRLILELSW